MKHCALILSSLLWTGSIWADETEKPNVLFIICDDLNDYVTGFGGHPQAKTPNLDRLISKSLLNET